MSCITVSKIVGPDDRIDAMEVIEQVFVREKQWIEGVHGQLPDELDGERYSWFLAKVGDQPAGVMRLHYDPRLDLPDFCQVSLEPGIDLELVKASGRFAEIGRFMILSQ